MPEFRFESLDVNLICSFRFISPNLLFLNLRFNTIELGVSLSLSVVFEIHAFLHD